MGGFITLLLFQMLGAPAVPAVSGTWILSRRGETNILPVRETVWTLESRPTEFVEVRTT